MGEMMTSDIESSYRTERVSRKDGLTLKFVQTSEHEMEGWWTYATTETEKRTVRLPLWAMREVYEFIRNHDWQYTTSRTIL